MTKTAAKKTTTKKKPAPAKKKAAPAKKAAKKAAKKKAAPAKKAAKKKAAPTKKAATKKTAAKKPAMTKMTPSSSNADVSAYITRRFADLGGFRGATLAKLRALIFEADPEIVEERKWIKPSNPHGVPTYSHNGLVLTLEVYKDYAKVTFAYGSKIADPTKMFNASLLGLRRAIDFKEGATVDAAAFKALVRAAVDVNLAK